MCVCMCMNVCMCVRMHVCRCVRVHCVLVRSCVRSVLCVLEISAGLRLVKCVLLCSKLQFNTINHNASG